MGLNAGKGNATHLPCVHTLTKKITFADMGKVISMGFLPKNAGVIASGVHVRTVFNAAGTDTVKLGFRASEQGATTDDDAFTETALNIEALGHLEGDVVSTANIFFSAPAEVTASPAQTSGTATTGEAYVYVTYVAYGNLEDL